jgi:hypothetical protein
LILRGSFPLLVTRRNFVLKSFLKLLKALQIQSRNRHVFSFAKANPVDPVAVRKKGKGNPTKLPATCCLLAGSLRRMVYYPLPVRTDM